MTSTHRWSGDRGKELPMYRLGYQPGCWPLRLRLTPPAVYRLARLRVPVRGRPLGRGPGSCRGARRPICVTAVNFSHKALCAAVFGGFGLLERSVPQLGFIPHGAAGASMCVHVAMPPVYLAAVRPFREALLQAVELTCHALEAGLFACALALVNARRGPPSHGCLFLHVALMVIVYELRRLALLVMALWRMWRERGTQGP
ncbi:hypothetical protein CHLRE_06g250567v5 [Chlamydomonas reinhardtii]|uniref:Uncharacterized protein n=1 Tax=Chlamydomonas reinhardtii TaxID=3055 RepID=A0A2K3DLX6_CHLRE|nr:uncharacterized protein CHLRE_06g250567v5 [Chlamydomonas reinhardtii]XP_042923299.1 uncharacterized protein CHLRE_06g250567v5 [Chlamydomonas reinhardtii]PNW81532.1 hypothetical protein CHLRE_06g250567v5 [Chlamydomonas reinhardtii]PNW81533.1 hypothetical protein CHLRE_06g250567v5 [Chlamydomonas reinhardtii]